MSTQGDSQRAGVTPTPLRGRALKVFDRVERWEEKAAAAAPGTEHRRAREMLGMYRERQDKFFRALGLIDMEGHCA